MSGTRLMQRAWFVFAVVAVPLFIVAATSSADPMGTRHCSKGWQFVDIKGKPTYQHVVDRRRAENATRHPIQATFTSKKSETVGWSADVSVGGGFDAIFFSVKTQVDGNITQSATAETGVGVQANVPRKSAVNATYGVFIRPVAGTLLRGDRYDVCRVIKRVHVRFPVGSGWLVSSHHL